MKNLNLSLILENIDSFVKERDWAKFHSVKNLVMALSVETSELVEIFQWLTEKESNEIKNREDVADEIADIFIYLINIANKLDVDIEKCVLAKIEKNKMKYPVEKSFGLAKKYDKLD